MRKIGHRKHALSAAFSACLLAYADPVLATDCKPLLEQFNQAIDTAQEADAQALVDKIAGSADCGQFQTRAQQRLAALRLSAAQILMARGRPVGGVRTPAHRLGNNRGALAGIGHTGRGSVRRAPFCRGRRGLRSRHRHRQERDADSGPAGEIRDRRAIDALRASPAAGRQRQDGRRHHAVRPDRARQARRHAGRHLFAFGSRHHASGRAGPDHVRICQDHVHTRSASRPSANSRTRSKSRGRRRSPSSGTPMSVAATKPT